jgi:hypothetical protein
MIDNKGNVYKEENYEGYGVFGGKAFYELLAEMNRKELPEFFENRPFGLDYTEIGIDIWFSGREFKSPKLIEKFYEKVDYKVKFDTLDDPEDCEYQGYFYPKEEEYDEEEEVEKYNEFEHQYYKDEFDF